MVQYWNSSEKPETRNQKPEAGRRDKSRES